MPRPDETQPQRHIRRQLEEGLLELQRLTNSGEAACLGVLFAWSAGRLLGRGFPVEMLSDELFNCWRAHEERGEAP